MLKIGEIVQTLKGLVETKIELVKHEIQDEFLGYVSRIILLTVIGAMTLLVLLFFSLSIAFYLSSFTSSPFMGFFLVGLFYLLVLLGLFLTRYSQNTQRRIHKVMRNFIFNNKRSVDEDE